MCALAYPLWLAIVCLRTSHRRIAPCLACSDTHRIALACVDGLALACADADVSSPLPRQRCHLFIVIALSLACAHLNFRRDISWTSHWRIFWDWDEMIYSRPIEPHQDATTVFDRGRTKSQSSACDQDGEHLTNDDT